MNEAKRQVAAIQANANKFKSPSKQIKAPSEINLIDELFMRLKAICVVGNAFRTQQGEIILKQEYLLALQDCGVLNQQSIDTGIENLRSKSRQGGGTVWMPKAGEFAFMCVGNGSLLEHANIALRIFNAGLPARDSVAKKIAQSKHYFDIKQMPASKSNARYIELYLSIAKSQPIERTTKSMLTEAVQLSKEQQKDAEIRAMDAQRQFLSEFSSLIADKPKEKVNKSKVKGVQKGKIQAETKQTLAEAERVRNEQLRRVGLL